ncbi:MAG TPA: AraC family transcriptional regulator, partial [Candidatus Cloacimonadota bacterium]|nr:AraC family transcriptional regulator [Candidatus Cloacimonadota bacterium]
MNYTLFIQMALDYIEDHLRDEMELEDIADHASFSLFHFHRIFSNITGWTMKDYIRTRRLSEAGNDLLFTDESIRDISLRYRFESQEAFTRAFKKQFNVTPGKIRNMKGSFIYTKPYKLMSHKNKKGVTMKPRIVKLEAMTVVGLSCRSTMKENTIPQLWDAFNKICGDIKNPAGKDFALGICPYVQMDNFTENDSFEYLATIPVSKVEDLRNGLKSHVIPAATYAVFTHKGPLNNLHETYEMIFSTGLEGYEMAEADQIEWYGDKFKFGKPDSEF